MSSNGNIGAPHVPSLAFGNRLALLSLTLMPGHLGLFTIANPFNSSDPWLKHSSWNLIEGPSFPLELLSSWASNLREMSPTCDFFQSSGSMALSPFLCKLRPVELQVAAVDVALLEFELLSSG